MSKLQLQLKENKDKIKREKFLSVLEKEYKDFIAASEYSSDESCIKKAAFPVWDTETNALTTSRGQVKNWNNIKFKSWQDLVSVLKKFSKVRNYIGWFFIDADGPYYRISLNAFFAHIDGLSEYAVKHDHYRFGWVGSPDDVGILIGYSDTSTGANDKKFDISLWGM